VVIPNKRDCVGQMSWVLTPSPANVVPAQVFGIWADYWLKQGSGIPAFHYYQTAPGGGALLVVALSAIEVKPFIEAEAKNRRFYFEAQGEALLPAWSWFGRWSLLSVDIRAIPLQPHIPRT
jgi:hypothetical protein